MDHDLIARYDLRVPRYTSYPTAPHFGAGVDGDIYAGWLDALNPSDALSLYLHIPFCDTLCWFCGCHTKVVNRYDPVTAYVADLEAEIALVTDRLSERRRVSHVHFGGGSPCMLRAADIGRLGQLLNRRFDIANNAEIAVEIDPRGLRRETVQAFRAVGANRVSLGVQDINMEVQRAINRVQPVQTNRQAVELLRDVGIEAINVDLMYGLPFQTVDRVLATVEHALALSPDRIALFGYAHVPGMKRHQRLIPEWALPDVGERLAQADAAANLLVEAGYVRIGLDHFAVPDDPMVGAAGDRSLGRNFQGYTTDGASALIGLGASAIGALPQGYVQNETDVRGWRDKLRGGALPVARGVALDSDDRLRRDIINALMCHLSIDLAATAHRHGVDAGFAAERVVLDTMAGDGLVVVNGDVVEVTERGRPLVRSIAAVFDAYLVPNSGRHSVAI